ncbi:hypothetical protein AAG906_015917 [Vitis piasezkii]
MKGKQKQKLKLLILYASQTEMHWMQRRSCPVALLHRLLQCFTIARALCLQQENYRGIGPRDTSDSMKAFWKFLLQRNLNQWWLKGVHYAVFGLGDSGYQKYNILEQWLLLKEVWRDLVEETCPPFLSSCPDI